MKRTAICLVFCCLAVACSVGIPQHVISKGKMESILYDYHRAQGMADAMAGDTAYDCAALINAVFEKHGVSEAEFDTSMVWYSGHPEHLIDIYKRIDDRLTREAKALGVDATEDIYANLTDEGDTAVVWRTDLVCLRGTATDNVVHFVVKADSTSQLGDTYELRWKNRFVVQEGQKEAYALLIARYEGDTITSTNMRLNNENDGTLRITQSDLTDEHMLTSIEVLLHLPYDEDRPELFRLWLVRQPMLVRFHNPDLKPKNETADTLETDTIDIDTISIDRHSTDKGERLSPLQMRDSHEGKRTIKVTKQRKVTLPPQQQRQRR